MCAGVGRRGMTWAGGLLGVGLVNVGRCGEAWDDVGRRAGRGGLGQCGQVWAGMVSRGGRGRRIQCGWALGQGLVWAAWMGGCRQPQLRSAF